MGLLIQETQNIFLIYDLIYCDSVISDAAFPV